MPVNPPNTRWSQLKHLRKSVLFLFLFAILLSGQRIYQWYQTTNTSVHEPSMMKPSTDPHLVLCKKVVNGRPIGVVDKQSSSKKRIYLFQAEVSEPATEHHWYYEGKRILRFECSSKKDFCISSIPPFQAKTGYWSVDVISQNTLIETKQFELIP